MVDGFLDLTTRENRMSKAHKLKDFVDAPRPEYRTFQEMLDNIKPPSKKKLQKMDKAAAERKRRESQIEDERRVKDIGKKYEIRFNWYDTASFYEDRCVLPAAAHWNMDEFLMVYLAAGIEALLEGPTDWNHSVGDHRPVTRKRLKKIVKLCRKQIDAVREMKDPEGAGDKALRMIAKIGVAHLWD
jgi:hypothetical protein